MSIPADNPVRIRRILADASSLFPTLEAGLLPWLDVSLQICDMDTSMARNSTKHSDAFIAYAAEKRVVSTNDI